MSWNPECHRARQLIPLLAGSDVSPAEQASTERHLRQCAACRNELAAASAAQAVLQDVRVLTSETCASVWPEVHSRLAGFAARPHSSTAGWIPVGALASACAALLLLGVFGPSFERPALRAVAESDETTMARDLSRGVGLSDGRFQSPQRSPFYSDTTSF